ncbi:MAG: sigma-70 family RNA polymerase sigma factor [Candidatus Omnitrophota bacterium]|nr:sigma-70 family RNA polymerase sigma factor [Candidatus Omnitrophota bacterium]
MPARTGAAAGEAAEVGVGADVAADETEIIGAVLQGEKERYGELVSRYQLAAWKLAYSFVGDWEEAKDLSQNGFIKAYRHLGSFHGGARFSTWLYRIIANECKDFLRRRGRQPELLILSGCAGDEEGEPALDPPDPGAGPRQTAQDRELASKLARAIGRLPMNQRAAFSLHHLNGLPLEEVSRVMGCREGTVKSHLFRAAQSLRRVLA